MKEKRAYSRIKTDFGNKSIVLCSDGKETIEILDVSPEGMKAYFPKEVKIGYKVSGPVSIHPCIKPFLVSGKVIRVNKISDTCWEAAVKFDEVRTEDSKKKNKRTKRNKK